MAFIFNDLNSTYQFTIYTEPRLPPAFVARQSYDISLTAKTELDWFF